MSMRSRSERKYARNKATATTWVQSGRPKLRRKGLAWFAQHHLKTPDYVRKPRRKTTNPVAEQQIVLGNLPIHHPSMKCACGSTTVERCVKHRKLEDSHWQVVECTKCHLVYRQLAAPKPTLLMSLTELYAGERCPLCNHSSFRRSPAHADIETVLLQVVICSNCDEVFRMKAPPQRERRMEPIPPVEGDGGTSWHRRGGRARSDDQDWGNRGW